MVVCLFLPCFSENLKVLSKIYFNPFRESFRFNVLDGRVYVICDYFKLKHLVSIRFYKSRTIQTTSMDNTFKVDLSSKHKCLQYLPFLMC